MRGNFQQPTPQIILYILLLPHLVETTIAKSGKFRHLCGMSIHSNCRLVNFWNNCHKWCLRRILQQQFIRPPPGQQRNNTAIIGTVRHSSMLHIHRNWWEQSTNQITPDKWLALIMERSCWKPLWIRACGNPLVTLWEVLGIFWSRLGEYERQRC